MGVIFMNVNVWNWKELQNYIIKFHDNLNLIPIRNDPHLKFIGLK